MEPVVTPCAKEVVDRKNNRRKTNKKVYGKYLM
jgi:hypothetical protein